MADKEEILRQITELAEQGLLNRQEMIEAFDAGFYRATPSGSSINGGPVSGPFPSQEQAVPRGQHVSREKRASEEQPASPVKSGSRSLIRRISVAEILFYIGGAIVFLGLVFMIAQNWKMLGTLPRLLLTLGAGIAAYYTGLAFSRDERTERAAPPFYLISALILPVGLYVLFDSVGLKASGYGYQLLISAVMLLVYLTSYFLYRKSIFVLFSILYGTWVFFSITSLFLTAGGHNVHEGDFYLYRFVGTGLSYLFLAQALARTEHSPICGFLNNFGLVSFLGAALALGGWKPAQNAFWEIFYPGFVFGAIFFSVKIRSTAYLVWGTVFLMLFLVKITNEYFTSSMGWPAALVLTGLLLIGVGYMTLSIKRRYLTEQTGGI